jgi:hypothetical protein
MLYFIMLLLAYELGIYSNFRISESTPIAVTAAPAPAPCTIKGRGLYLSVWKEIMLSDPPNEVAKAWVTGYLGATWQVVQHDGVLYKNGNLLFQSCLDFALFYINYANVS